MRSVTHAAAEPRVGVAAIDALPADPIEIGSSSRAALRSTILAMAIGLLTFLLIQGLLAAYNVEVIRDAIARGQLNGYPSVYASLPLRLATTLTGGGITYVTFSLVAVAIARRGHRWLFVLPAASYVLIGALDPGSAHHPTALGFEWNLQCFAGGCDRWFSHPWIGPLVDLALVLIPGCLVAFRFPAHRRPTKRDAPSLAALLVTLGVVTLAGWTIAVVEARVDIPSLVSVGAMGITIGIARPWWPWLHVLFGAFVTGALTTIVWFIILNDPSYSELSALPYLAARTWPMVAIALLASAWQPVASVLRRSRDRPLSLALAVNVLNVADAVLTATAVRGGYGVEANPFVRFGGLPGKVLLVGILTWLLYRRQAKALLWPAAALLLVLCYHVAGIAMNP
jgi:hypothetical protein